MAQRSRGFQPTAWQAKATSHVFKPVVPLSDHGTHVNLHRHLSTRYQRADMQDSTHNISAVMEVLYKQRASQRVFSCAAPNQSYPVNRMVRRLSLFDPQRSPPNSKLHPSLESASRFPYVVCSKPVYSGDEVRRIVDRLHQRKQEAGRSPPPEVPPLQRRRSYPAAMLEQVIDTLESEENLRESRALRSRSVIAAEVTSASRKMSKSDVDFLCARLNEYNPRKWPPDSRGVADHQPSPRVRVKYPARSAPNQRYIDEMVERLHHANDRNGNKQPPPEKRHSDVAQKRVVFAQDDVTQQQQVRSPRDDVTAATPLQSARSEEVEEEGEDPVLREMMRRSSKQDGGEESRLATPRTPADD